MKEMKGMNLMKEVDRSKIEGMEPFLRMEPSRMERFLNFCNDFTNLLDEDSNRIRRKYIYIDGEYMVYSDGRYTLLTEKIEVEREVEILLPYFSLKSINSRCSFYYLEEEGGIVLEVNNRCYFIEVIKDERYYNYKAILKDYEGFEGYKHIQFKSKKEIMEILNMLLKYSKYGTKKYSYDYLYCKFKNVDRKLEVSIGGKCVYSSYYLKAGIETETSEEVSFFINVEYLYNVLKHFNNCRIYVKEDRSIVVKDMNTFIILMQVKE